MAERMGERAEPCPTPTLVLNMGDKKLFQEYMVKQSE